MSWIRSALSIGSLALSGALVLALGAAAPTPAAAGGLCYGGGVVGGDSNGGVLKKNAKKRARGSWKDAAQSAMGTSRARNWDHAENKRYYCHHTGIWYCTAYARPCA